MSDKPEGKSFWTTIPGILTGCAAVITAIGGIVVVLVTTGIIIPRTPTPTPPKETPVSPNIISSQPIQSFSTETTSSPPIPLAPTETNPQPVPTAVKEITVTISNVASGKSYSYFTGKLTVGVNVYSDRDYAYSKIPSFLNGKTYIATPNADLFSTGTNFLILNINRDAMVYVAHDDRYMNKPPWLNDFQDTGTDLEYLWQSQPIKLSLYVKQFSAGQVVLGGNVAQGEQANHGMYTVVITEK